MLWTVSPRDGSRCPHFSRCRSTSQSEDEDEAQHCNCTLPQMQKTLINFKPLQDSAAKFNASLDYLPAHQERARWKGHSHRVTGCTWATSIFERSLEQLNREMNHGRGFFVFLHCTSLLVQSFLPQATHHWHLRTFATEHCGAAFGQGDVETW